MTPKNWLIKKLGGYVKPELATVKGDEYTANTMTRTVDDIKLQVVTTHDAVAIMISAWNPEIAFTLFKNIQKTFVEADDKEQAGVV